MEGQLADATTKIVVFEQLTTESAEREAVAVDRFTMAEAGAAAAAAETALAADLVLAQQAVAEMQASLELAEEAAVELQVELVAQVEVHTLQIDGLKAEQVKAVAGAERAAALEAHQVRDALSAQREEGLAGAIEAAVAAQRQLRAEEAAAAAAAEADSAAVVASLEDRLLAAMEEAEGRRVQAEGRLATAVAFGERRLAELVRLFRSSGLLSLLQMTGASLP